MLETPCRKQANPFMQVCTKQYQKRIDNMLIAANNGTDDVLPHICWLVKLFVINCKFCLPFFKLFSAYAELTECAFVITLLKCGKDDAFRVFKIAESLRKTSSPLGCESYEYGSLSCESVLFNNAGHQKRISTFSLMIIALLANLLK